MTQLLGFATGFLMSVGVVLYVTGEAPWRDTVCKVMPGCEAGADTATAQPESGAIPNPGDKSGPVVKPKPVVKSEAVAKPETKANPETRAKPETEVKPLVKSMAKAEPATKSVKDTAAATSPQAAKKVKPLHRPETIVPQEKALVTVPTAPAPKIWDAQSAATPAGVLAPPITGPETTDPIPAVARAAAVNQGNQQHIFWPAFNNAVSASGFAELINEKTGLDIAVIKERPGNYAVAIAYENLPQLQQNLDLIELAVGVKPLQGRLP
ncbi:hypothetical protein FKG94_27035 [Exilibacterium tricleocarpae]|uniref:SPOR domain-containing protein n=1 Tax=Exilibacterium tricleocarpae TaxID=2591008 RepID=A0A545SNC2_9GAMM|nr:hypothetical protein [Exilibacterium tricleocarpae]TQV66490.1 hypothetical protein FKG94_27035 [Exilibacterium tricleocarpae]